MARGWESKAVESQQEERARDRGGSSTPRLSAEERIHNDRVRGLELTATRVRAELRTATHRHHRDMLEEAIRLIEQQIRDLRGAG